MVRFSWPGEGTGESTTVFMFPHQLCCPGHPPPPLPPVPGAGHWDSLGTRTPRMTVNPGRATPQRCHPRSTQKQRSTEGARRDHRPLRSNSETDEEVNPGPSGLQSPSKFRDSQGEHWEAGVHLPVPHQLCVLLSTLWVNVIVGVSVMSPGSPVKMCVAWEGIFSKLLAPVSL